MNKRTLAVSFLTAGMTAGLVAGAVGPAAAQGNPVGGSGNVYYLGGAGSIGGNAQETLVFGDPGDEVYFGDWDNDGTDTPMVNRNGVFFVADKAGKTMDVFAYGNPGDRVIIGDWDGKNGDSMAVVRQEQGTNRFFVKNDVKKSGTADDEFFYGNAGDNIMVGDWDGNGTDTLMVTRPDTSFHVKNDTKTGNAEYSFFYGDPGDTVLVGDWANPSTLTDGDGADQVAIRRDGNHYFLSTELGKDKKIEALRDFRYGEPTDTVFVAALPTQIGKAGDVKVAADDVVAKYKKGEVLLRQTTGTPSKIVAVQDGDTTPQKATGDEPKVRFKGELKYYRGTEKALAADGQPIVYVKDAASVKDAAHQRDITAGGTLTPVAGTTDSYEILKYAADSYKLNADGSLKYTESNATTHEYTPAGLESNTTDKITVKVGDFVLEKRGAPVRNVPGAPAVYEDVAGAGYKGNVTVETSTTNDYKLDANGDPIPVVPATSPVTYEKNSAPTIKAGGFAPGTPVTHRRGEKVTGYRWIDPTTAAARAFTGATVTNTSRSITISTGDFTSADIGRELISSTPAEFTATTKIVSVLDENTVTVDKDIVGTAGAVAGTVSVKAVSPTGWQPVTTIDNDEDPNVYLFAEGVTPSAGAPTSKNVKVSTLDADTKPELAVYNGTERVYFDATWAANDAKLAATPYTGAEKIVSLQKGEALLDKDGNQQQLTADDVTVKGDGLGVRRNFGR
jgi:hypothetical protein